MFLDNCRYTPIEAIEFLQEYAQSCDYAIEECIADDNHYLIEQLEEKRARFNEIIEAIQDIQNILVALDHDELMPNAPKSGIGQRLVESFERKLSEVRINV